MPADNCISNKDKKLILTTITLVERHCDAELYHIFMIFTGSIARSANLPVFNLLRGRF